MKYTRSKMTILAMAFTVGSTFVGHAESLAVRNCTWCHGGSAQGYTPAPRLAGQRYNILRISLRISTPTRGTIHFRGNICGARRKPTSASRTQLGDVFFDAAAEAADDGDRENVALGRTIYQEGMPDSNIVACVVCHGPNAEGVGQIPRLGGLAYTYLKRRLEQWGEGYHAAAGPPMPDISSKLSQHQIEALASYLSFVK